MARYPVRSHMNVPARPPERLPGQWTHCNVCGRPLSDRTSRYHGVGPDCLRRTGIHYPQGPINPELARWEQLVESMKDAHAQELADAHTQHDAAVLSAKEGHAIALARWESDSEARVALLSDYEARSSAWRRERAAKEAALTAWKASPLQRRIRISSHLQAFLFFWGVTVGGVVILLWADAVQRAMDITSDLHP